MFTHNRDYETLAWVYSRCCSQLPATFLIIIVYLLISCNLFKKYLKILSAKSYFTRIFCRLNTFHLDDRSADPTAFLWQCLWKYCKVFCSQLCFKNFFCKQKLHKDKCHSLCATVHFVARTSTLTSHSLYFLKEDSVLLFQLHEVYKKVCERRNMTPLDISEFITLTSLVEARGILKISGKTHNRLSKVTYSL